jgi:hypothetical protein
VPPLHYYPRRIVPPLYQRPVGVKECVIELMIADNQALTVQNTLQHLGIAVTVRRQIHWEIHCDNDEALQKMMQSGVIYNDRKEKLVESVPSRLAENTSVSYLVRAKDDLFGQQKQQMLADHFGVNGVKALMHGVLWHFQGENVNINELSEKILLTNIIQNPYAQDYYQYSTTHI